MAAPGAAMIELAFLAAADPTFTWKVSTPLRVVARWVWLFIPPCCVRVGCVGIHVVTGEKKSPWQKSAPFRPIRMASRSFWRPCSLESNRLPQHHGDVVRAAIVEGGFHQAFGGGLQVARARGQQLGNSLVRKVFGQPVTA